MKKIILPQILLAVLIIGSYYFYKKAHTKNSKPVLTKNLVIEKKYEGAKLRDDFFRLIESAKRDTSHLVTPKLVFRFTDITCSTCVTMGTRLLVNYAKKIGWDNIVFLATNKDVEYLNRYKRISRIKTKIYRIGKNYLAIDYENLDTPYMFTVGSDSTIKNLFIAVKENASYTEEYLKKVSSMFEAKK